ncbi:MAG: hypothetical protein HFH33_10240 [Eubacterium sp.]|jgi:lysophospholipase L1-like esterase|nr:hypothetical protein [Eubacterium sp.]
MKKWITKSEKAVFITIFFTALSLSLQSSSTSVLAKEAESGKHNAVSDFWQRSADEADTTEQLPAGDQTSDVPGTGNVNDQMPDDEDGTAPATPGAEDQAPGGAGNAAPNAPGTDGQAPDTPVSNDADANDQNSGAAENPAPDTPGADGQAPGDTAPDTTGDANTDNPNPDNQNEDHAQPEQVPQIKASLKDKKNTKAATIQWNSVKGAAVYKVQRSQEKDGKFKNIAQVDAADSGKAAEKYKDTDVKRGNRYFYRIAVKMESGTTCYSNVAAFTCPYTKVSGVRLARDSASSVKVSWNPGKNQQPKYYKVYYTDNAAGDYKLAGTTRDTLYRVSGLQVNRDYYFKVKACAAKKASGMDGALSDAVKIRTAPYNRTTIFAGDSITVGLRTYNILSGMSIQGNKGIVAEVGLNTTTFRTRRVFEGKTGVEAIIAAKPYRVYLMLGDNEIHYRSKEDTVAGYREILKRIQAGTPDTDIVVLAATPVTSAKVASQKGFAQIPAYNESLKALAKSMGVRYFDCTDFLKDSSGWLKTSYAAGDGIHWKVEAYREYARRLEAYDRSLEQA